MGINILKDQSMKLYLIGALTVLTGAAWEQQQACEDKWRLMAADYENQEQLREFSEPSIQ